MSETRLILGGPGTGKTTHMLNQVQDALSQGVPSDRIAFVSFTKAAVEEARNRAMDQFSLREQDLPHFRTIHSLCYRALGLRRNDIMGPKDWEVVADAAGVEFTPKGMQGGESEDDLPGDGATVGDQALSLIQYARAIRKDLKDVWQEFGQDISWVQLELLDNCLREYKSQSHRLEFADLLTEYLKRKQSTPVRIAIIDEAQDLTAAQWAVVRTAFADTPVVLISGDDDQAIHTWAGAATRQFLSLECPRFVLPVSYRLPPDIFEVVQGIARRIQLRFPKEWSPANHEGRVYRADRLEAVRVNPDMGTWMILARSHYQLKEAAGLLRWQGVPYRTQFRWSVPQEHVRAIVSWERQRAGRATPDEQEYAAEFAGPGIPRSTPWFDALTGIGTSNRDYYRAILRSGRKLTDEPRVLISTIHGVKGQEADHVVLLTDVTAKVAANIGDAEHRVFLVGASRARQSLTIVTAKDARLEYSI